MPETKTKRKAAAKPTDGQPTVQPQVQPPVAEPRQAKIGRPSDYNLELAAEICTRISNGEALRQICMEEGMPSQASVYLWIGKHPEFSEMYTRAREEQADTLADEIQTIADEMPMETTDKDGQTRFDSAYIQWMRLRVDARKWVAAKLKPRKYGDKIELSGDKDNPLHINAQVETKSLFSSILENMELRKQARE